MDVTFPFQAEVLTFHQEASDCSWNDATDKND